MPGTKIDGFVERVSVTTGNKEYIPEAWTQEGHPFYGQFRQSASQRQLEDRTPQPSTNWTIPQLRDYAERAEVDLTGSTTKADILAAISAAGAEKE